jgi:hypothetical protein
MARINPSQVQQYLSGVDYPATREDIVQHAERQGAEPEVLEALESLPMQRFQGPNDVSQAISQNA